MSQLQKHQLLPALTITDEDFSDPAEAAKKVRLIYQTMGKAFQDLMRLVDTDPRMSDTRIAHGLYTQQGDVLFDYANMPNPGQVLYGVDGGRRGVWGDAASPSPSGGGVGPLLGGNNVLLDGSHHTDTDGTTIPFRGDLVVRVVGNLWSELSIGLADTFIRSNGNDPIYTAAVGKTGAAKVTLGNQAGAIGATNLIAAPTVGLYLVSYYLEDTAADVTAGTIQLQVNYTDHNGATNQKAPVPALPLTAIGSTSGSFVVFVASGVLSYQTNLVGIIGTALYALTVRVVFLG